MTQSSIDSPAKPDALSAAHLAEVASEQTRLLISVQPVSASTTVVIAAILAYSMIGHVPQAAIACWFGAILTLSLSRLVFWHVWRRDPSASEPARSLTWQSRFQFVILAAGIAWGSAALWIYPTDSLALQVFMGFVLACVSAGGITTLGMHLKSYGIFLLPTLLPYSSRLILEGGELQIFMGIVFLFGVAFLLSNARRFETVTVNALTLHYENARLVSALRSALHEAEQANQAKTHFLAKMSHEIRTPLSGMIGMTELLHKTNLTQHQQRLTVNVSQSAATLQKLVADLLDISRIESGQFTLEQQPFDLRTCIEDAIEVCSGAGYRKGLEIHLIIADPLPLNAKGDCQRLYQVLVNLISSSVKFIEVGQITLNVTCQRKLPGRYDVTFSISDNGIGIARKDMERLFAPLTSAEADALRRSDGRDLSLAVTRHLVDSMGGTVSLSSEIGKGTAIRFTLPIEASTDSPIDIEPTPAVLAGTRILVIDDRPLSREAIVSRLQSPAARIDTACCEDEALSKLRRAVRDGDPFDIAVMDRIRPRHDNFPLHRKIVASPDLSATKVIALMPMQWTLDEATAAEFDAASFVSKPVRKAALLAAIDNALRHTRSEAPTETATAPHHTQETSAPSADLTGLEILLAEDNPVNQEVAMAYLDGFGCNPHLAVNGLEAIQACEHNRFDMVLMDCQMPEVDGLTAIRHIRAREQNMGLRPIPILMVTANAFASDREQALTAGADDFLSKPYTEQQLMRTMKQLAARAA